MITLEEAWPPYAVRLRQGDLDLRVVRDEDLPELIAVAADGVHDPDAMPFLTPWTRQPAEILPREYARFHWRIRSECSPERFALEFVVRAGGEVVGTQGLNAADFAVTRCMGSGSWLGRRFHGRGIGTRMRQAVCAFAFDVLGAQTMTSEAFLDNPSSQAVSRKVGYADNGQVTLAREGKAATEQRFLLRPETFHRNADPLEVTGAEPLLAFLGLAP